MSKLLILGAGGLGQMVGEVARAAGNWDGVAFLDDAVRGADVAGSDRFGQLRQNVNDMLTRFRKQDFSGATHAIERCRKFGDGFGLGYLFDLYSERIQIFEENPPPADWNGVFVLETK